MVDKVLEGNHFNERFHEQIQTLGEELLAESLIGHNFVVLEFLKRVKHHVPDEFFLVVLHFLRVFLADLENFLENLVEEGTLSHVIVSNGEVKTNVFLLGEVKLDFKFS